MAGFVMGTGCGQGEPAWTLKAVHTWPQRMTWLRSSRDMSEPRLKGMAGCLSGFYTCDSLLVCMPLEDKDYILAQI